MIAAIIASTRTADASSAVLLASVDLVGKIDSFYNSAWTKLVVVVGFVGVIVPVIISFIQSKNNDALIALLRKEIKDEVAKANAAVEAEAKRLDELIKTKMAKSEEDISKLEEELTKSDQIFRSGLFFLQARAAVKNDPSTALASFLSAAKYNLLSGADESLRIAIEEIGFLLKVSIRPSVDLKKTYLSVKKLLVAKKYTHYLNVLKPIEDIVRDVEYEE